MTVGAIEDTALAVGDEVIYPANNPLSGFVSRIVSIEGDEAICKPTSGAAEFPCRLSDLRLNSTEGS